MIDEYIFCSGVENTAPYDEQPNSAIHTFNSYLLMSKRAGDRPDKKIRVSEEVGVHFKQRAFLKNERRQYDLGKVHANADLRQ